MKRAAVAAVIFCLACSDTVAPPPPKTVQTSVDSLSFTGVVGEPDPPPQSFGMLTDSSWHVTTSSNWIVVAPDSGRGDATLKVSVRPLLLVGDITDTIRITAGQGVAQLPIHLHRAGRPARGLLYGVPYVDPAWGQRDSIFLASSDGSSPHALLFPPVGAAQLLPTPLPFWGAMFAPGGDSLAFLAYMSDPVLVVATADGTILSTEQIAPGFCRQVGGGVGWSSDGRTLAWTCNNHAGEWLVMTGQPPMPLAGGGGIPYWSPDGTWIMVGARLMSADSSRSRPDVYLSASGLGWTPDGRIVVLGPTPGPLCGRGVFTISPDDDTPKRLLGPEYDYAAFSPDGKKLLARRCAPAPAIELMDADGTNVTWTMPGADWAAWRP